MFGQVAKISRHGIISIAVSNWIFLFKKIITVSSAGEAVRKTKGFWALKSPEKSNKNKQKRLPVVVEKNISQK